MLVNIGSGVSILKVTGDNQSTRISGSALGGGTFWGLCGLLTGLRNFDQMLDMSAKGNNSKVGSPAPHSPKASVFDSRVGKRVGESTCRLVSNMHVDFYDLPWAGHFLGPVPPSHRPVQL